MAYRDFKDLGRRTVSNEILRNKAFNIAKNSKYDGYQRVLASSVYNFFDKKAFDCVATLACSETLATQIKCAIKIEIMSNKELAEELYRPIIRTQTNYINQLLVVPLRLHGKRP